MLALLGQGRLGWRPFGALAHHTALRDVAHAALARVGLGALAGRRVVETSYGERRRLELAMALAQSPCVLLLDEPLAGLSSEERDLVRALLDGLPRDLTILLIEHDMDVAWPLPSRSPCCITAR